MVSSELLDLYLAQCNATDNKAVVEDKVNTSEKLLVYQINRDVINSSDLLNLLERCTLLKEVVLHNVILGESVEWNVEVLTATKITFQGV